MSRRSESPNYVLYDLTHLDKIDLADPAARRRAWDELHLVSALQGLANRNQPNLYVLWVGDKGHIDRFWLEKMQQSGEWMDGWKGEVAQNLEELLERFSCFYRGLVVWDEKVPATSNLASTIAGAEDLLPVRFDKARDSLFLKLTQKAGLRVERWLLHEDGTSLFSANGEIFETQLPSTTSAKCDAYRWGVEKYLRSGKSNPCKMGYYPDAWWILGQVDLPLQRELVSNHDYFIAHRGFLFDLSPWDDDAPDDNPGQPLGEDFRTLKAILQAAYDVTQGKQMIQVGGFVPWDQKYTDFTGGKHEGVPSEWRYSEILSCFNAYMDADAPGLNAMANASFFQHYPLQEVYPQRNLPTRETLQARGLLDQEGRPEKRTYVSIYVGDYDSAAWLYQRMPDLWENASRGKVALGWAFNPNLCDRFPVGMAYARKSASPQDTFVAGDSGAGYLNPGYLTLPRKWSELPSGLDLWKQHCTRYYRQWDLHVTGFVIDGFAPEMSPETLRAYASFSDRGLVTQYSSKVIPRMGIEAGMPFLRMDSDLNGSAEEGAQQIAQSAPEAPGFAFYRTILWSPEKHAEMFAALRKLRPDIEVVEPHTLLLLLKEHLENP